jgi:hypothetical protein
VGLPRLIRASLFPRRGDPGPRAARQGLFGNVAATPDGGRRAVPKTRAGKRSTEAFVHGCVSVGPPCLNRRPRIHVSVVSRSRPLRLPCLQELFDFGVRQSARPTFGVAEATLRLQDARTQIPMNNFSASYPGEVSSCGTPSNGYPNKNAHSRFVRALARGT